MVYDLPNKLIMPALWNQDASCSMLGLGDILLPGLYLAFLNKFDKHVKTSSYLDTGLIAYALSLVVCVVFLVAFDSAQPALLYIVPALFAQTYLNAWCRGELEIIKDVNLASQPSDKKK